MNRPTTLKALIGRTILLMSLPFGLVHMEAHGQCANNNTLLPGGTISPNCPGQTTVPCITGGQYALINVTTGNNYTFSTCGATFDTQITLYNNAGGGSLGFNDDSGVCGFLSAQSYLAWTATFTGQLRVLVDQYNCANNNLCASLIITCATAPAPVTNNECGGAIPLFVADGCFMQTYSNVGATRSTPTPNPTCGGPFTNANFRDVWFSFTAPPNGVVIIESVPGTLQDGVMQLVAGTCASFTNVECDDDDGVGYMPRIDRRCLTLTPNAPYMIRFWGLSGTTGTFGLCVRSFSTFPTPQEDCSGAFTVCNDQALNNSTNYTGCSVDLTSTNRGCLMGNERQGTWYFFSPSSSGTIGLNIVPTGNVDYDFAVWGPYGSISCPPPGPPVRCSWAYPPNITGYPASVAFQTGMRTSSVDPSEADGPAGAVDGFTSALTVVAGQNYILYIDNFDVSGQAFTLDWQLSGGASLDCTVLPIEVLDLAAHPMGQSIAVEWTTTSAGSNATFVVERSHAPYDFVPIGSLPGNSDTGVGHELRFMDHQPLRGLNYYRIKQLGGDGSYFYSSVVSASITPTRQLTLAPNPATDHLELAMTPTSEPVHFQLHDATGRILNAWTEPTINGPVHIPIASLYPGVYTVFAYKGSNQPLGYGIFVRK